MSNYSFENKYDKQTYFEFYDDGMKIKEVWIGNQIREFYFKYSDISRYSIVLDRRGYYSIDFWSNEKKIKQIENGQEKYVSLINIKIKKEIKESPLVRKIIVEEDENDIRSVIYNNTPLRSELDMVNDKLKKLKEIYTKTPENEYGMIYIQGPVKNFEEYVIQINGINFFVMYTEKQEQKLKDAGLYNESIAKPYWIDNKTIAFKIPYGKWPIGYSFRATSYASVDSIHEIEYITGPQDIEVMVDRQHNEIKIGLKKGLLKNKLIELK